MGMPDSRTILITGASSGIGKAIAEHLLGAGHRVVGVARDASRFPKHAEFIGHTIDLADLDGVDGGDGVVQGAGRGLFGGLEQASYPSIRGLVELNFTSQAYVARAILPVLKRLGRGDLVFLGSEAALEGKRMGAVYCATKFAVRGLAQALREECSRSDVRVSVVHPGMVKTPFFDALDFGPGDDPANWIEPGDVAAAVALILTARPGTVFDDVRISPLKKVVRKRSGSDNSPHP